MIIQSGLRATMVGLLGYLRYELLFSTAYSTLIYILYEHHQLTFLASFGFLPIGFFGTVLSVFLAFRNNNAYDRWWEARKLWGQLVNQSRTFGARVNAFFPQTGHSWIRATLIRRHLCYINMVRLQLRGMPDGMAQNPYMTPELEDAIRGAANPATQINERQAQTLRDASMQGALSDYKLVSLMDDLRVFYDIQGACERIKNTPFPRESDGFIRLLIWLLMLLLPVYLLSLFSSDQSKLLVIPLTLGIILIVGFANMVGAILEDPFENRIHDVPLTTICNTIERDLLPWAGEVDLPPKSVTVEGVYW